MFVVVAALFVAISLPVVLRGAPLADDFTNCLQPQRVGLGSTLGDSLERLGAARKAHLLEIIITTETCQHAPFGLAIAISLGLTLAVALLLRGLLSDLGTADPWPGSEALSGSFIPSGPRLRSGRLRCMCRSGSPLPWPPFGSTGPGGTRGGRWRWREPVSPWSRWCWLFPWPSGSRPRKTGETKAFAWTVSVVVVLLVTFVALPGDDPRLRLALSERVAGAVEDPGFLVLFAAVGLGLQSIPLAVAWAFPFSVVLLAAGALLGLRFGAVLFARPDRTEPSGEPRSGRSSQGSV